jgi:hypothetical protein
VTDKDDKRPDDPARTPAEGKAPAPAERPGRRRKGHRPKPLDRLGYLEDFLPSD